MIKSYTDIEQSKKLAEILPLESADMHYCLEQRDIASGYEIGITPYTKAKSFAGKCNIIDVQPAWSLAALLNVFEDKGFFYKLYFDGVSNVLKVINIDNPNIHEMNYNDYAIDVCYEMILKLREQKLL